MSSLYEEIQAVRGQFPEGSRSATIPALRLAQEQYGWLPPQAIREVADALDLTPAYCHAVASFYDMFHLEPVGERDHRSTSPMTVSREPTIAIMSATSASLMHVAVASSATNDGARNLTRHGRGPPSETT